MKKIYFRLTNDKGSVTFIALVIMLVLTIIGISAIQDTGIELNISRNDRLKTLSFYAAESGRAWVARNTNADDLYGTGNIDKTNPKTIAATSVGGTQTFSGNVLYTGFMPVPPGMGYEVGEYLAHTYTMTIDGQGPDKSASRVQEGFFRVGF